MNYITFLIIEIKIQKIYAIDGKTVFFLYFRVMKDRFLHSDFMLSNDLAKELYSDYASTCPIIDYHNHLPPEEVAVNKKFADATELWLDGDHYKWRAMRANGIDEEFITGEKDNKSKFYAWARTVPKTLRNPLYTWTHLELRRYFGIVEILNEATQEEIFQEMNAKLNLKSFQTQGLLAKQNVKLICTTDDPIDDLKWHKIHKESDSMLKMLPAWRPDNLIDPSIIGSYNVYLDKLSERVDFEINSYDDLLDAIDRSQNLFGSNGCVLSDHGLNEFVFKEVGIKTLQNIYRKIRARENLSIDEIEKFRSGVLTQICKMNAEKGWVQQFHVGPLRDVNKTKLNKLGPNTGFDSIGSSQNAREIGNFLDNLEKEGKLAKTILYNSNPADNYLFAAMTGNFQDGEVPGKIQFGAAWWFLDQKEGIEMQMNALSNLGLLSRFVGMVTDSRSFLSFPRHEYFRRVLCDLIGRDVENGLLPNDINLLGATVQDICYNNALEYFGFNVAEA